MNTFHEIEIKQIKADIEQPRKDFDDQGLKELAESIKAYGMLQPILVRPNEKDLDPRDKAQTYTIIAGERRYRAAILAGYDRLTARIRQEKNFQEVALVENVQRKDLNKIEEAEAIKRLMQEKNYNQEQVAEILSKSRPYVTNSLRLLKLQPSIQKALIDEIITDGHARVLAGIGEEEERRKLLDKIINEKMSVRETENYRRQQKKARDLFLTDALEQLEDLLDNRVYTRSKTKDKGTLCIDYGSEEELERIVESLMSISENRR